MLTKEECAAIVERFHECDYLYDNALYQILFGHNVPSDTTFEDDSKAILERLADLIDPTCHIVDSEWDNGECTWGCICKECGAKFEHERAAFLNYCPSCGARVVRDEA